MGHTRKLGYLPPCVAGGWVPLLAHFSILLLLLVSFTARAADDCWLYKLYDQEEWTTDPTEACNSRLPSLFENQPSYRWALTEMVGNPGAYVCKFDGQNGPPGGGGAWQSAAYAMPSKKGSCDKVCERIEGKKTNITIGYHATPSDNLKLNPATKYDPFFKQLMTEGGGTTCIAGCEHFMYKPGADTKTWVSQVAGTNGLCRSSADVSSTQFATPCGGAPAEGASPSAPIPECNGALGDVNGATVCLPRNTDTGVDLGGLPDATRGNPVAGDVPTNKDDKERASGPGGAGNGSGTGGASNGGGASGGPATGSNNKPGGKGCNDGSKSPELPCSGKGELDADGTTDKPGEDKEQQACGAPGQPKCRIDETGTPDGKDAFNSAKEKLDSEFDKLTTELEKIKSPDGKDTSWGVMPTWIQTGACSPWNLGTLPIIDRQITIDICAIKPYVDGVMNFLWALGTFFAVISMVFRVTTNTSS